MLYKAPALCFKKLDALWDTAPVCVLHNRHIHRWFCLSQIPYLKVFNIINHCQSWATLAVLKYFCLLKASPQISAMSVLVHSWLNWMNILTVYTYITLLLRSIILQILQKKQIREHFYHEQLYSNTMYYPLLLHFRSSSSCCLGGILWFQCE